MDSDISEIMRVIISNGIISTPYRKEAEVTQ